MTCFLHHVTARHLSTQAGAWCCLGNTPGHCVTNQALPPPAVPATSWTMSLPRGITHFRAVLYGGNSGPATGAPFPPSELPCQAGLGGKPLPQTQLQEWGPDRAVSFRRWAAGPALPSCLPAVLRGQEKACSGTCSLTEPDAPPLSHAGLSVRGCAENDNVRAAGAAPPCRRALVLRLPTPLLRARRKQALMDAHAGPATPPENRGLSLSSQGCTKMPLTPGFSVSTEPEV